MTATDNYLYVKNDKWEYLCKCPFCNGSCQPFDNLKTDDGINVRIYSCRNPVREPEKAPFWNAEVKVKDLVKAKISKSTP